MRKVGFILAVVLMLAAPACAEVLITCAEVVEEPNVVVVVSFVNTEGQHVRGFALDIIVDGGSVITAVECLSTDYYIYPGSIQIADNEVTSYGTCVCDADLHPDTLPGLDTNGVTIEMAAAYSPNDPEHNTPPADSGALVGITLSGPPDYVTVCIRANGIRGGVVMENMEEQVDINAPILKILTPGDICGKGFGPRDCKIDSWDVIRLSQCYNKYPLPDPRCDLTGKGYNGYDGKSNSWDVAILSAAWAAGPINWQ